jgi:hypothetical protein
MVSESINSPEEKRVSGGKKSPSDRKERGKLNKKPRKVRQWKPHQVEEVEFNSSTALGLLESTKTRTLAAITCTMSNGSPGTKCDGTSACARMDPEKVGCGSCNGYYACDGFGGESSKLNVQC